MFSREMYQEIADLIRERTKLAPAIGMILGSGLGDLEQAVEDPIVLPYAEIPHFPVPKVKGHGGRLVMGELRGHQVAIMSGRAHYYEGHSLAEVTLPVRVLQALGASILIVTNAAGGLKFEATPGDLMLISDHINLVGMAGHSPLWGANDPALGPRFPDMNEAYDPGLRRLALEVAEAEGISLHEGVYAAVAGPSFETPAEIRFLRTIGADAVGMSTAHEVIVARHAGMRVLGISGISNLAVGAPGVGTVTHEEVLESGQVIVPRMRALIQGVLTRL